MSRTTASRLVAALAVAVVSVGLAIIPELLGARASGVSDHHLKHAVLILGGAIAGVLACRASPEDGAREHPGWLVPTLLAPVAAMFAMWPTTYDYVESHPPIHVLEHLVILGLAAAMSYAGERCASGIGWVAGALVEMMAIGAALGYGIVFGSS